MRPKFGKHSRCARAAQHLSCPRLSIGRDVPYASPAIRRSLQARRSSSVSDFRFHLQVPGSQACTKHLSGILIGELSPLRVPETHRFPRSSIQYRVGSLSSCLWARERGRARKRSALRRSTIVRRGGGFPIKPNGCRECPRKPSRDSRRSQSQIFGSLPGFMTLALPLVLI